MAERFIPRKMFDCMCGSAITYRTIGHQWAKAGRTRQGAIYDAYCVAEREYNDYMDRYFNCFDDEQREYWAALHANMDALEAQP